jgi:hypothetical protein
LRPLRILAAAAALGLVGAALVATAQPASAASVAPPPQWLRDTFQFEPPASLLRTPATIAAGGCPSVTAYVSRGSDENPATSSEDYAGRFKYYGGVGEEMSAVVNYLATLYPSFKVVPNASPGYPAQGLDWDLVEDGTLPAVFMDSVEAGAVQAIQNLNTINASCPATKLVIIGYSQGALVSRLALASHGSGPAVNGNKVNFLPAAGRAATLLFGDPSWGRDPASYGPRYEGDVMRPGALPAGDERGVSRWAKANGDFPKEHLLVPATTNAAWNEVSYCHGRDLACQFEHQKGQIGNGEEHLTYDEQDFFGAGNQAAAVFATGAAPLRVGNAKAVPSTDLASPQVCLPRAAVSSRTATMAASAVGAPSRTFTSAWVATNLGPGGTVHAPLTLATGAAGALTVTSSSDVLHNDTWQVTTPTGITGVPDRIVHYQRMCPTLGVPADPPA